MALNLALEIKNGVNVDLTSDAVVQVVYPGGEYTGDYVVTPTESPQVLQTADLVMVDNLTVNPIPSNYGRIEWNGSALLVS